MLFKSATSGTKTIAAYVLEGGPLRQKARVIDGSLIAH